MPVVFREGGLRFFFYSNEGLPREPAHIHVRDGNCDAKIWIEPDISIAESYGFNSRELTDIIRIVTRNRDLIASAWHEHFSD